MILKPEEYNVFLEVHLELLYYAGTKYHLLKAGTSLQDFKDFPLEDYINQNQTKLSSGQISILDGFRRSVMSDYFIILKCLEKYAIFIDSESKKVFGVTGLSNPFQDFFHDFPIIVKAIILPFNGRIVYDGFLQSYGTYLGPNMTREYNEIYKEAKQNRQIISSLDPPNTDFND